MRPFVYRPEEKAKVVALRKYAEENPLCEYDMRRIEAGEIAAPGDDPERHIVLPIDYRLVFTVEDQPGELGRCRHLSISTPDPGRAPNPYMIEMVMPDFGFEKTLQECYLWMEDIGPNHKAVNILEPL